MATGLKVIGGAERGAFFTLRPGTYNIGRDPTSSIQLDSPMVSKKHATVRVIADQITIKDLGSSNGTIVNHRRIQEQVLVPGDKIFIGDYILEMVMSSPRDGLKLQETMGAFAPQPTGKGSSGMGPFPSAGWKAKVLVTLLVVLAADHLMISQLFSKKLKIDSVKTELTRASALVRYLAAKNKDDLIQEKEMLLDTDTVMQEEGVIEAIIANSQGRILAPTYKMNRMLTDEVGKAALAAKEDKVLSSGPHGGSIFRFAVPIRVFGEKGGNYTTIGVAQILFSPKKLASTADAVRKILLIALTFIPVVGLLLFIILHQITLRPITYLAEKIGLLLRGDIERIDRRSPIQEMIPLIDTVNAAAVRLRESHSEGPGSFSQPMDSIDVLSAEGDGGDSFGLLLKAISDAAIVLDGSGMILAVNESAKELLEIEEAGVINLYLPEVITNSNFKVFLEDALNELKGTEQPTLTRSLEYGDFSYQCSICGERSLAGELQKIVVVIEKI